MAYWILDIGKYFKILKYLEQIWWDVGMCKIVKIIMYRYNSKRFHKKPSIFIIIGFFFYQWSFMMGKSGPLDQICSFLYIFIMLTPRWPVQCPNSQWIVFLMPLLMFVSIFFRNRFIIRKLKIKKYRSQENQKVMFFLTFYGHCLLSASGMDSKMNKIRKAKTKN